MGRDFMIKDSIGMHVMSFPQTYLLEIVVGKISGSLMVIRAQEESWCEGNGAPNPVSQVGKRTTGCFTGILCVPACQVLRTHPFLPERGV